MNAPNRKTKSKFKRNALTAAFIHGLALMFFLMGLMGCSKSSFQIDQESVEKLFTDNMSQTGYRVLVEKPTFQEVAAEEVSTETRASSDSKFAVSIKNVRLDMDDLDPSKVNLKILLTQGSSLEFSSSIRAESTSKYKFTSTSKDSKFQVSGFCAESFCEHASFVIRETQTEKYVYIDYTRSLEYLKPEDLGKIKASNKDDRDLLNDVIEYHLPITRHAARIAGRDSHSSIVDLLIVARPQVDAQEESLEDDGSDASDTTTTEPQTPQPAAKPADEKKEEHTIELEAISEDLDAVGKTDVSNSKASSNLSATLTLTSNPYDVYKIKIPTERLKGLNIQYPSLLPAKFEIVPAEQQQVGEPAHRIALLAEAFVESEVKIYKNACNIYVRAVMMLAGYTKGGSPLANQYAQLFQTRGQGLNEWARVNFAHDGSKTSGAINNAGIQGLLNEIPDGYATVAQWVRAGRHGHVGIVARLDNRTYFMDGNLNNTKRGLRKTEVNAQNLINIGSRKSLTIYGMKGVIKNRSI